MQIEELKDSPHIINFSSSEEAQAIAAACREGIVDVVRDSCKGEDHYEHPADPALAPLAQLAVKAACLTSRLEVDNTDLYFLKLALKTFSDPKRTKQAVNELALTQGHFGNRAIEERVFLGHAASKMLTEIDPEFADEDIVASRQRYSLVINSSNGNAAAA